MRLFRPWLGFVASTALLAVLPGATASAQTYGHIYGAVYDEEGGALPGVTLTLSGMGAPRISVTNERGEYRFLNLDPGGYSLSARLDGFSTVEQPNVVVALNRNVTLNFTLSGAVEETLTVTSETPLLDERHFDQRTVIPEIELEKIPTTRDPWALLTQAPGVLTDRVNVGGSESGFQPIFIAPGSAFWDNDYLIDGIQITDMNSLGAAPTYFDFEQFESIDVATGGTDVTKNTSGVAINMVTRRGTNEFRGTARFLSAKRDGLGFLGSSSSSVDCADLHPDQDCEEFTTNGVEDIAEYGFEAGGAAIPDRLWFWGSYGFQDISIRNAGGQVGETVLENESVKLNAQLSSANSAVASWNNGDKRIDGRGAGPGRAREATWNQRGPSAFWRFEDTHVFGSNLFLTGSYQKSDLGFALKTLADCHDMSCPPTQESLWDSDGVIKQNDWTGWSRRPEEAIRLDGSYFFETGEVSHELKFGGRVRESTGDSNFVYPGRNIIHIAGENFGEPPGPVDFMALYRPSDVNVDVNYQSLWVQDTIAAGNWTANVGARYDLQDGVNRPGSTGPSAFPDFLPTISFDDSYHPPFDWETVEPRLGLTYAFGGDRTTLLRTSFSRFASALGAFDVGFTNPTAGYYGYGGYAYFYFIDGPEDNNIWDGDEPAYFMFSYGFDPRNPESNLNSYGKNPHPETTTELVLGVEHSPRPELVIGATYTWRQIDDTLGLNQIIRPFGSDSSGRPLVAADFVPDGTVAAELPDGSVAEVEVFALDPTFEYTSFQHYDNDGRGREYNGVSLTLNKRLANHWALRGYVNWGRAEWQVPQRYLDRTDPNPAPDGDDQDGAVYSFRSWNRSGVYMQSDWQANLTGLVQIAAERPWGVTLSGNVHARQGYVLPYSYRDADSFNRGRTVSLLDGDIDRFRLDDLVTVDLRAEKEFAATGNVSLTVGVELFNALNDATVLGRRLQLQSPRGDYANDILSPRIWKLGVRVAWR